MKLSELTKTSTKDIVLSCGVTVTIKKTLTVQEQLDLGLSDLQGLSQSELIKKTPEIAFKLITAWDIVHDDGKQCEISFDTFKLFPISFKDMEEMIQSCESLFPSENIEKKNSGEN